MARQQIDNGTQKKNRTKNEEFIRTVGSTGGGAMLGAAVGGPVGAFVGGAVGFFLGRQANENHRNKENGNYS